MIKQPERPSAGSGYTEGGARSTGYPSASSRRASRHRPRHAAAVSSARPEPRAAPRATALLRGVQSGQAPADTEQTRLGAAGQDGADCLAGSGRCLGAAITLWTQTAAAAQHRECSTCRRITRF